MLDMKSIQTFITIESKDDELYLAVKLSTKHSHTDEFRDFLASHFKINLIIDPISGRIYILTPYRQNPPSFMHRQSDSILIIKIKEYKPAEYNFIIKSEEEFYEMFGKTYLESQKNFIENIPIFAILLKSYKEIHSE